MARVLGFEALARWSDAELGPVSPGVFIPLAEERAFIDLLTEVLLKKAARAALSWPDDLFLSFNLSSAQLMDPATSFNILAILNRVGLDPRRLELEITETAMMSDPETAQKIVNELRAVGVRVSLDDFGTGQSSLGRLRDFTFDKVKIDRAFVSEITTDRPSEHIIKAILAMCEGLDLKVVAEGIEDGGAGREASRARMPERPGLSLRQADERGAGLRAYQEEPRRLDGTMSSARVAPDAGSTRAGKP